MTRMSRRTLLVLGASAATSSAVGGLSPGAVLAADLYPSNSALYRDCGLNEGVDYARRYRRHEVFDNDVGRHIGIVRSVIVAPHGGGIEPGTSELCLAIAGYHPATLVVTPAEAAPYDYWIFEGLRASGNAELHVTSTHCDDGVAVALCAGSRNALALHGCTPSAAGLLDGSQAVVVGGRNAEFKQQLLAALSAAGILALDGSDIEAMGGDDAANIANRTLLGMGGQLELTTPLRQAMFEVNTQSQRKETTTEIFWIFVAACRSALAEIESSQLIL